MKTVGTPFLFIDGSQGGFSPIKLLLLILIFSLTSALCRAVLSLPGHSSGLSAQVLTELKRSGVSNPLTAVVLNFRGYDTLLEMGVLLLAAMGSWSLGTAAAGPASKFSDTILLSFVRWLLPIMVLVAAYLLWVGKSAPGGAFQAGAVLGAAGILLLLSVLDVSRLPAGWPVRLSLVAGISVFLGVAAGVMAKGYRFLEYPPQQAGNLILLIESAATVSIAVTLVLLFIAGRPPGTRPENTVFSSTQTLSEKPK